MKYLLAGAKADLLRNAQDAAGGDAISPGGFVDKFINVFIWVIGGVAVIMFIIGGLRYVLSGGDPKATQDAKNTLLYALIGIVIALAAGVIVKFVIARF